MYKKYILRLPRRTPPPPAHTSDVFHRGSSVSAPEYRAPVHHGITHSDLETRGPPIDGPTLQAGQSHGIPYN